MEIKTLGQFREITKNLPDNYEIEMRIRRRISDEEMKELADKYGRIYPYPYETDYSTLEFDDVGVSDRVLCLGVEINNE